MSCGIAAVDPTALAVEHVDVDEVGERVDLAAAPIPPDRPMTLPASPARAISSTQISFESAVPWLNGWPRPSVRTTVSTRYDLARIERGDLGPEQGRAASPSIVPPSRSPKRSTRTLLVLEILRVPAGDVEPAPEGGAGRCSRRRKRWSWISRPGLPSKSFAPKSFDAMKFMWQSIHWSPWPPADSRSSAPRGPRRPRGGTCRSGSAPGGNPCSG